MASEKPSPVGLAILICDQIIEDVQTRKKSLIGTFNNIATMQFPFRHPQLCVFVSLTEGQGAYDARLRIAHEETGDVVAEVNGQVQFPDRNFVAEFNFNLVGLEFKHAGLHSIEFYCDETLVLERRFHVTQMKSPPKGPPPAEL
jgi:hypothetical protein